MIFLLSLAFSLWYFVNGSHIIIDCEPNCNVTDKQIKGEERRNITLRYEVTRKKFTMFQIRYPNSEVIVNLSPDGVFPQPEKTPKFIDFTNTKIQNTTLGYYFTFQVLRLNRSLQDSEFYGTLTVFEGGKMRTESKDRKLDIVFQAEMLSKWISRYDAKEYSDINIAFILSGNPKPNVTAHIDNTYFDSTSSGDINHFDCKISLKNISRDFCGKYVLVEALGYKRPVRRSSLVHVVFTPNTPNNLAATRHNASCLDITWHNVRSGHCSVNYTLFYSFVTPSNQTNNFTAHTNLTLIKICVPSLNTSYDVTFRVRAEFEGHMSSFSDPLVVPIVPPTIPPTTTVLPTTTQKPTTTTTTTTEPTITTSAPITRAKTTHTGKTITSSQPSTTSSPPSSIRLTVVIPIIVAVILLIVLILIGILIRKGRLKCSCCNNLLKLSTNNLEKNGGITVQSVNLGTVNAAVESDYADIGSVQPQSRQPIQETDYAELGPGGRVGTRPAPVEQSLYAQVNTDSAYYPSLKPQVPSTSTPETEYAAVSTTAVRPKSVKSPANEPEYAVSSKSKTAPPQPPGQQGKRSSKKAKAPNPPEPEYAVSTKHADHAGSVEEDSTYI